MRKIYLTLALLFFGITILFAQAVFSSNVAAGNWNSAASWSVVSGADGDGMPDSDDDVYVQSGHAITLTQNESCNDIHISTGTVIAGTGSEGAINLGTNTLSINGKLRCYWAAVGVTPGTSYNSGYAVYPFNGTGKVSIVGNTRPLTLFGEWGATITNASAGAFICEINLNAGQTVSFGTNLKCTFLHVVSGTLDLGATSLGIDNSITGQGNVLVDAGCTIISSGSANNIFQRTGTTPGGTLTVNGTLNLTGATPKIQMTADVFNGTVVYSGTNQTFVTQGTGGSPGIIPLIYTNVTLSNTGLKTTVAGQTTNINGILSLQNTAALVVGAGGTFGYGAAGVLEYKGSIAQTTTAIPAEWPNLNGPFGLTINNTNGVTLNATGGRAISGALTLTNGILKTTTLLTMNAGSNVAAVSNTSFVDSAMKKIGNTDFIFPVGRIGIGYVPIQIVTFGSGTPADEFTAAYSRSSAEALGTITAGAAVGLNHVSRVDYWKLDHIGTITADVILYWTAGSSSNGSASYIDNLSELAIAHFNGTQWDSYAIPAVLTPLSTVTAGSIKWQLASTFGSFSLASSTINNPLPINLNYLNGFKQGNNNLLKWKVTCTNNPNATMSVQRSADGRNYNSITTVFADALRCQQPFDYTDNNAPAGLNYYRLKMVDANGKITYSAPIAILNKETGFDIVNLSPTLVNTKAELNVTAAQKTTMTVVITDVAGKQVQKMLYNLIAGSNKFTVNAAGLSAGTYQITGYTADGKSRTIRFVKQ
jgi:hypothetical protein